MNPNDTLATERLVLRRPVPEEAEHLAAIAADPSIPKNLGGMPHPFTQEMAAGYLRGLQANWGADGFAFGIYRIDGPPLIGMTGLHGLRSGAPTIHYWLATAERGRGYATEVARAMLGLAFETLRAPHIDADHFLDNPASGRVLEKCGFAETERRDVWSRGRGHYAPGRLMRLTREDWERSARDQEA